MRIPTQSSIIPPKDGSRRSLCPPSSVPPKDQTRRKIEKMEADREERRRAMQQRKQERADEEKRNIAAGNPGDVDFIGMVRKWREEHANDAQPYQDMHPRICICVRKRPVSDKERAKNDHDSVTCLNPAVWIHSAKVRVDGITKYLDHTPFHFDHAFDETVPNAEVYKRTAMPLLDFVCSGVKGRATVFAYGQTGSGKTHTMTGIQEMLSADLFLQLEEQGGSLGGCSVEDTVVKVSFFELYGGNVQDLLNDGKKLKVLEDGKGEINISGLLELEADDPSSLLNYVETGNKARTTHATEANDASSRSHAICQITLRDRSSDELKGKFSLVDLAGSERGTDTKSHSALRRAESSDINTSLLALKECIRALDMNKKGAQHVPYRQSKLTLILKDCFTSESAMTAMIATVSPGASSCDHSINTLRYADRIKEKRVQTVTAVKKSPPRATGIQSPKRPAPPELTRTRVPPSLEQIQNMRNRAESYTNESSNQKNDSSEKTMAKLTVLTMPTSTDSTQDEDPDASLDTAAASPFAAIMQTRIEANDTFLDDKRNDLLTGVTAASHQDELFEQEEAILNMHMSSIHENAELLSREGIMLKNVQKGNATEEEIAHYVSVLESTLDRKEDLILQLQRSIALYQQQAGVRS